MIGMEILKPLAVLAGWTMLMWIWMYAKRIPAMNAAKIDSKTLVGGTGKSLDDVLPAEVQWIAHNYNHLHEAPTVFYAVALALAVIGHVERAAFTHLPQIEVWEVEFDGACFRRNVEEQVVFARHVRTRTGTVDAL